MKTQHQQNINLDNIKKKQPFKVPENYFEDLPERIQANIQDAEKARESNRSVIQLIKPALSLAAMFIGVALIAFVAVNFIGQPEKEQPSITNDIAKANYEKKYHSEEAMIEAIKEKAQQEKIKNKKADEYINYLLNEDIDYNSLIDELQKKEKDSTDK